MPSTKAKKAVKITPVMLAKDVLKWLQPGSKVRIRPLLDNGFVGIKGDVSVDLQAYLKAGKPCEVCARGALVAAKAYRVDMVQVSGDDFWRSETDTILDGIFNPYELNDIEEAFERGKGLPSWITSARGRLKAICQNIITNKGKFVPAS